MLASRSARTLSPLAFLGAAFAGSPSAAADIDFDGYPHGTPITTQYQAQGVVFATNGGGPCTIFTDPPEATSSPNILCGADNFADIFAAFVNPATGEPVSIAPDCVSLNVISAGHAVVELRSRDAANAVLESFTLTHPGGPAARRTDSATSIRSRSRSGRSPPSRWSSR